MERKKVVIIGGGFGGLSAAIRLARHKAFVEVVLIDKKPTSDFLPCLPDCIGRRIKPRYLSLDLKKAAQKSEITFIQDEVKRINLEAKEVVGENQKLSFDYLLISAGSETNFYGNDNIARNSCKLDDAADVRKICEALAQKSVDNYVIGGGGYTGVEVAANLGVFLNRNKRNAKVVVVERAPTILGPLPQWIKDYTLSNLRRLNIEVIANNTIEKIEDERVSVSGGRVFDRGLAIWAAGVKTPRFIQDLAAEKNLQGRIKVDAYLRLNENCFVIGDAALVEDNAGYLRMAVQFAITQGGCAAGNIIRSIKKRRLRQYRAFDLGYIIPMANNRSCGVIFGINLKGKLPTVLHFIMCIFRSWGIRNKLGIIGNLIKGGGA